MQNGIAMKRTACSLGIGALVCLAVVLPLMVGCETDGESAGLVLSPSSVTLSSTNNTATFTVSTNSQRALSLPLEWSVSDPSLGNIVAASGWQAIYARLGKSGNNVVTAKDQYGSEGHAVVSQ